MENTDVCKLMYETFMDILTEDNYKEQDEYIADCILNSVSPVIRIDYHNGIVLCVNRDEYGTNNICKMIHDYGNESSVYIDGEDILYWD